VLVYQNRVSDIFEHYGSESSEEPLLIINCQGLILVSDPRRFVFKKLMERFKRHACER
jgi:hypothetical protein